VNVLKESDDWLEDEAVAIHFLFLIEKFAHVEVDGHFCVGGLVTCAFFGAHFDRDVRFHQRSKRFLSNDLRDSLHEVVVLCTESICDFFADRDLAGAVEQDLGRFVQLSDFLFGVHKNDCIIYEVELGFEDIVVGESAPKGFNVEQDVGHQAGEVP
jgi:hypothetical protein